MATDLITQERLQSLLTYDPNTGEFRWLLRTSNRVSVGQIAGCKDKDGYVVLRLGGRLYKAHRLAWLYVHGRHPTKNIDHINQTPGDNRIANLREADQHENNQNRRRQATSRSGVNGVSLHKASGRWHARIYNRGKCVSLGYYDTLADAAVARARAERGMYPFRSQYADASL
jgi:hypothetical protein